MCLNARRLQQQLDEAAASAGAASHMSAAQIALQRRESEAAEKTQRQLHAATDAVTALKVRQLRAMSSARWLHSPCPLQARVEELTEEAASQAGQRQAAERIADALRAELLAARASTAASAAVAQQAADEASTARQLLAAQVRERAAGWRLRGRSDCPHPLICRCRSRSWRRTRRT